MKPIQKFNSGMGAILCHSCGCIIKTGKNHDVYLCNNCINRHNLERTIRKWGVNFNKHGVSMKKTEWRQLTELTNSHLENIISYFDKQNRIPAKYIITELAWRNHFYINITEDKSEFTKKYISPIIRFFGKLIGRKTTNII